MFSTDASVPSLGPPTTVNDAQNGRFLENESIHNSNPIFPANTNDEKFEKRHTLKPFLNLKNIIIPVARRAEHEYVLDQENKFQYFYSSFIQNDL